MLVLDGSSLDDPSKASGPCLRALVAVKAAGVDLREFLCVLDATNPDQRTLVPKFIRHAPAMSFPARADDTVLAGEERGFMCLWRLVDYLAGISARLERRFESVGAALQAYIPLHVLPVYLGGENTSISVFAQMRRAKAAGSLPPLPRPAATGGGGGGGGGEEYRSDPAEKELARRMDAVAKTSSLSTICRPSAADLIHMDDRDRLAPMHSEMEMNTVGERMLITSRSKGAERVQKKMNSAQMEEYARKREEELLAREKALMKRARAVGEYKAELFCEDKRQRYEDAVYIPRIERETTSTDASIGMRQSVESGMGKKFMFL